MIGHPICTVKQRLLKFVLVGHKAQKLSVNKTKVQTNDVNEFTRREFTDWNETFREHSL